MEPTEEEDPRKDGHAQEVSVVATAEVIRASQSVGLVDSWGHSLQPTDYRRRIQPPACARSHALRRAKTLLRLRVRRCAGGAALSQSVERSVIQPGKPSWVGSEIGNAISGCRLSRIA